MKHLAALFSICLLSACMGGGGTSVSTLTAPSLTTRTAAAQVNTPSNTTFGSMLNNTRLANGAGPVSFDARLGKAAQAHAEDMLRQGYFSHTGRDGSKFYERIAAAGYNPRASAENIASNQTTEAKVLEAWTNSEGHHINDINPVYEDFGFGKAESGDERRWVLLLATER